MKSFLRKIFPTRKIGATILKWLSPSSEVLGPPKGVCSTVAEWVKCAGRKRTGNKVRYVEIYRSHEAARTKPSTLGSDIRREFEGEYKRSFPAAYVATFPEGRIWSNEGYIITPDDRLIGDVSVNFSGKPTKDYPIFLSWKLSKSRYLKGVTATLASAGGECCYYHWMLDVLPRFHLLQEAKISWESIDHIVLNKLSLPFQFETLSKFGIPKEKIVEIDYGNHIKTEMLVLPSLAASGNPPYWATRFLRDQIFPNRRSGKCYPRRIYITRKKANSRRILNEEATLLFLKQFGFEEFVLENMPVIEQAELFSSAECVISPNGSSLTNLVFCEPQTKVVEIFSPDYVNVACWILANHIKLDYSYLLGEEGLPSLGVRSDILVNIDSLSAILSRIGIC